VVLTGWRVQYNLRYKKCDDERSGGSLSQNELNGNVKGAEHFHLEY